MNSVSVINKFLFIGVGLLIFISCTNNSTKNTNQRVTSIEKDLNHSTSNSNSQKAPLGFVFIVDVVPNVIVDARYFSNNNFIGDTIDGYFSSNYVITKRAADSLITVAEDLAKLNYGIKVFDSYRPQDAVDHFVRWSKDLADTAMKQKYYPTVSKKDLIRLGYIAAKSSHSRGSTVDVTIYDLNTKEEISMGSPWDYFGPESGDNYRKLFTEEVANRYVLKTVMLKHGFKTIKEEWWHYTLRNEEFKDTVFNFPI